MIYEITGLISLVMLGIGIGMQFGMPYALIVSGILLFVLSVIGAKNRS